SFDAQLALARGLIHLGDAAGALPAASRASALRPGDPGAREAAADALWLGGRPRAAFEDFAALATELSDGEQQRILAKARSLYRQRAGWLGRLVASSAAGFAFALRRGWLRVR